MFKEVINRRTSPVLAKNVVPWLFLDHRFYMATAWSFRGF